MQTFTPIHPIRRVVLVLALALVASLWLAPAAFAQPTSEQMQQRMAAQTDTLVKKLDLTAAQDEPVRAILAAHNEKQMELRDEARASGSRGSGAPFVNGVGKTPSSTTPIGSGAPRPVA